MLVNIKQAKLNKTLRVTQAKRISRSLSDILQESDDELDEENREGDSDMEMGSENGDVPMPDAMTR